MSAAGRATMLAGSGELERVTAAFVRKFPQLKAMVPGASPMPWGGIVFLRIAPRVISLLDYRLGFGHTELYDVAEGQLAP
ncbi:hypothetical protein [Pseudoduganella namucuonensis]|nr:hypothetical protein [Pseudoduganella namucuonensis]